jgi:hypothetical protein
MVETYGVSEERFYYIAEATAGTTPVGTEGAPITMLSVPHETIDPGINLSNQICRGGASYDAIAIKAGIRNPTVRLACVIPSSNPIELIQWAKRDLNTSLSVLLAYHKGNWGANGVSATNILTLLYNYLRINKLSVSCQLDGVVKADMELIGQNIVTGTSLPTYTTFTDHTGAIGFNETGVTLNGASEDATVTGFRIDVNNGVKQVPVIRSTNGNLAKYVPFGKRTLSGEIDFEFESMAQMTIALASTPFAVKVGLGGTNNITLSGCEWSNIVHQKWLDDLIQVKATFDAVGPLAISAT